VFVGKKSFTAKPRRPQDGSFVAAAKGLFETSVKKKDTAAPTPTLNKKMK